MEKEEKIKILNYYIGCGKLNSRYNFFALEENMGKDSNIDFYNFLIEKGKKTEAPFCVTLEDYFENKESDHDYKKFKDDANKNKLYECISLIYNHFNNSKKIKNHEIGSKNYEILLGNFYPIGKPNTSECEYPIQAQKEFNIKCIKDYENNYRNERERIFMKFISENFPNDKNKKYIFTFGFTQFDYYKFFQDKFKINFIEKRFDEEINDRYNKYWYGEGDFIIYCFYHTGRGYLTTDKLKRIYDQ